MALGLSKVGYKLADGDFFDTIKIETGAETQKVVAHVLAAGFNVRNLNNESITISMDEPATKEEVEALLAAFASYKGQKAPELGK